MKLNKNTALRLIKKYVPGCSKLKRNNMIIKEKIKICNHVSMNVSVFGWKVINNDLREYEFEIMLKELDNEWDGFIEMKIRYKFDGLICEKMSYLINECGEINWSKQ